MRSRYDEARALLQFPSVRTACACPGYGSGCSASSGSQWKASISTRSRRRSWSGCGLRQAGGAAAGSAPGWLRAMTRERARDAGAGWIWVPPGCSSRPTRRRHCPQHGRAVATVSWVRHRSRFTADFEDQVAWLAKNTSKLAVTQPMRITWRSVGSTLARVVAAAHARADPLHGLRRGGPWRRCAPSSTR